MERLHELTKSFSVEPSKSPRCLRIIIAKQRSDAGGLIGVQQFTELELYSLFKLQFVTYAAAPCAQLFHANKPPNPV